MRHSSCPKSHICRCVYVYGKYLITNLRSHINIILLMQCFERNKYFSLARGVVRYNCFILYMYTNHLVLSKIRHKYLCTQNILFRLNNALRNFPFDQNIWFRDKVSAMNTSGLSSTDRWIYGKLLRIHTY